MIATNLAMILPSSPSGVGVFEAAALVALGAYGVPDAQALSCALVIHALNFFPFVVAGLILLRGALRLTVAAPSGRRALPGVAHPPAPFSAPLDPRSGGQPASMSLVVPWLLFPVVLGLLSLGVGLLIRAPRRLQAARGSTAAAGFAGIAVVTLMTTTNHVTAGLTTPLVLALAIVGLGLSFPWRGRAPDWWALPRQAWACSRRRRTGRPLGPGDVRRLHHAGRHRRLARLTDRLLEHGRT